MSVSVPETGCFSMFLFPRMLVNISVMLSDVGQLSSLLTKWLSSEERGSYDKSLTAVIHLVIENLLGWHWKLPNSFWDWKSTGIHFCIYPQLFAKLQEAKQEIQDMQEEHIKERQELEQTQDELLRELKLKYGQFTTLHVLDPVIKLVSLIILVPSVSLTLFVPIMSLTFLLPFMSVTHLVPFMSLALLVLSMLSGLLVPPCPLTYLQSLPLTH